MHALDGIIRAINLLILLQRQMGCRWAKRGRPRRSSSRCLFSAGQIFLSATIGRIILSRSISWGIKLSKRRDSAKAVASRCHGDLWHWHGHWRHWHDHSRAGRFHLLDEAGQASRPGDNGLTALPLDWWWIRWVSRREIQRIFLLLIRLLLTNLNLVGDNNRPGRQIHFHRFRSWGTIIARHPVCTHTTGGIEHLHRTVVTVEIIMELTVHFEEIIVFFASPHNLFIRKVRLEIKSKVFAPHWLDKTCSELGHLQYEFHRRTELATLPPRLHFWMKSLCLWDRFQKRLIFPAAYQALQRR